MKTMRAYVLAGHGELDQLVYHKGWPVKEPDECEVLVKVHACGLNNTDVNTRTAWYSKGVAENTTGGSFDTADDGDATWGGAAISFPRIQGADVYGTVVAVGTGLDTQLLDQNVLVDPWIRDWNDPLNKDKCGFLGSECDGGFAEYTTVDYRNIHPIQSDLSAAELATVATACVTAENMLERANVGDSDTVLVPGASGGVGSALIQLANRRGAKTIALASESKHAQLKTANPTVLLPRSPTDLKAVLLKYTGASTVSVVADTVGGAMWPTWIDLLERGGRYTCAGAIAGPIVEMDLRTFYLRDLTFTGATVVPPGVFAKLIQYIESGELKPILAQTFPLSRLHQAQQAFIDKKHVGNIVIMN
jgi:NADPH:quinone reductase-like Zn-dependent oxidoreductase